MHSAPDERGLRHLRRLLIAHTGDAPVDCRDAVADAKRAIIREALERTGNHQTRAAELPGLSQPCLARLMKNLGPRD